MAKNRINYSFAGGDRYTDIFEARFAHINQPDKEYEKYSVTLVLPENSEYTKALFKETLEFENKVRADAGLDPVDAPSNWRTQNGKDRKDDQGNWTPVFMMNETNSKGQEQRPKVFNLQGDEDASINVWGGDKVIVCFTLACWEGGGKASAKYLLKGVQQIKSSGNGGGGKMSFSNQAENAAEPIGADVETEDNSEIPF